MGKSGLEWFRFGGEDGGREDGAFADPAEAEWSRLLLTLWGSWVRALPVRLREDPRDCHASVRTYLAMTLLLNDASIETLQSRFCFGICCGGALGGKGRGAHLVWCGGEFGCSPGLIRPFGRGSRGRNVRPTCLAVRCEASFPLGEGCRRLSKNDKMQLRNRAAGIE